MLDLYSEIVKSKEVGMLNIQAHILLRKIISKEVKRFDVTLENTKVYEDCAYFAILKYWDRFSLDRLTKKNVNSFYKSIIKSDLTATWYKISKK